MNGNYLEKTTFAGTPLFLFHVVVFLHHHSFFINQWDFKMEMTGKEAFPFDVESFRNFQPKVWQNAKHPGCGMYGLVTCFRCWGVGGGRGGIDKKHCWVHKGTYYRPGLSFEVTSNKLVSDLKLICTISCLHKEIPLASCQLYSFEILLLCSLCRAKLLYMHSCS